MECYICTDTINVDDMKELKCNHRYHQSCLMLEVIEQIKISSKEVCCPYCREKQSDHILKDYLEIIQIKNCPFSYTIIPKFQKSSVSPENYDSNCCSVFNINIGRQCKRQKKEKLDNIYKYFDVGKFEIYNDYEYIKKSFCTYHQNNQDKIKYFVHPVYYYTIRVSHDE
jgi:hypothetical protein